MQTTLMVDSSSSNEDWIAIIQHADHVLSLCSLSRTSAIDEAEYAKLLSEIVADLRDSMKYKQKYLNQSSTEYGASRANIDRSKLERIVKAVKSFLSQIESRLDPDSSHGRSAFAEGPALRWQLKSDEVTHFVHLADDLFREIGSLQLPPPTKPRKSAKFPLRHQPGAAPFAPPYLYIYKLNDLRDRLSPPRKLSPWVNMSELRLWLDHCDKHHSRHCSFSSQSARMFIHHPRWLVDVNRLCLIPAEPRQRYVALSYVWGTGSSFKSLKQNIDRLQQEQSLLFEESLPHGHIITFLKAAYNRQGSSSDHELAILPRTIQDAIELTQRIGEKFLWVDSLCIVQNDEEEKQEQLSCMGSIYANAYVTIVAAGGTAFSGLRGIEYVTPPMKREVAKYLQCSDSLHQKIQYHHHELRTSTWNHRAWTFQEQIFSRRLLIFSATEVSWECHCAVWFEGMEVIEDECQNNKEVVAQGFSFGVQPSLWDYACHVEQYNCRALTYPEDALNAFGGILTALNTVFIGGFICGLPSMFFNAALLWYNKSPLERRHARRRDAGITLPPTWAWAAWGGGIAFRDYTRDRDSIRPLVQWKYKANNQALWQSILSLGYQHSSGIQTEMDKLGASATAAIAAWTKHDNERDLKIPIFSRNLVLIYCLHVP